MRKFFSVFLAGIFLLLSSACAVEIPVVDESPGVTNPDTAGFRIVTREEVVPPEPAPDFTLWDQDGAPFTLADQQGRVVMISFLYTNCPEACPLVAANFVVARRELAEHPHIGDLTQVLVSTDPERDTENRRRVYTTGIGGTWSFVGGPLEEVAAVWESYDIYRELVERNVEVVVYHSYRTYLIDRDGQIRFAYVGVWYPDDIRVDLVSLLEEE